MNKTIQCDGATLAVKTKFIVLSFKPFMLCEKALCFYKDGKLLFKCPILMASAVINELYASMDQDYYEELCANSENDKFTV